MMRAQVPTSETYSPPPPKAEAVEQPSPKAQHQRVIIVDHLGRVPGVVPMEAISLAREASMGVSGPSALCTGDRMVSCLSSALSLSADACW